MPMQSNKKFFKDTIIYVGIDVHAKQWHVYASPWPSLGVRPICMPPDAKGLLSYLKREFPGGKYQSAYESGFCGFSVHRELTNVGIENIVFNAADLRKSQKEHMRKSDSVDCRSIFENLAKGDLTAIFVPTEEQESNRELIRGREVAVKDMRRAKQRIKMFLYKLGIEIPDELKGTDKTWANSFINWLNMLADSLDGGNSIRLKSQLEYVNLLKAQIRLYNRDIHEAMTSFHAEMYQLLKTIPGIGSLLSAKLCLELMDFSRFADARHLAGYIGLVPDCRASDKNEVVLGTTIRRNSILRTALIEASWIAIRIDPSLGSAFHKYRINGKQANVAIISIARKLANRIFYVHRTHKPYEISKD